MHVTLVAGEIPQTFTVIREVAPTLMVSGDMPPYYSGQ